MATYTLNDALVRVYRTLRDVGTTADKQLIVDEEIEDYIGQATTRYSADRPLETVVDVNADGTRYIGLPVGFEDGFSVVYSIEYPIDDDPPSYLDPREVDFYRLPTALKLRCAWAIPSGTANIRLAYSGRRSFASAAINTTVLDRDFDAVCDLATSICCDAIAQKYARTSDPVLSADAVAPRDKAEIWGGRARRYEAKYRDAVGSPVVSGVVNWDSRSSWRFGAWMTHPRSRR